MIAQSTHVPLREACKLIGLKPHTLRSWAKTDKIKTFKTPNGQFLYNKQELLNIINFNDSYTEKENIIYCRVTSEKQTDDLQRQINLLQSKYPSYKLITDCSSGIDWERKGFKTILELSMSGKINELVVAHKDRLCRFGFELVEWIITTNNGKIIILDQEKEESTIQELAEDLLSIARIYTCKQMGNRRYSNEKSKNTTLSESSTKENTETVDGNIEIRI